MPPTSPAGVIRHARDAVRRNALRRELQEVATGKATAFAIDLDHSMADAAEIVEELTRREPAGGPTARRIAIAFRNCGHADGVVERLGAKSPQQRARSARLVGALQMYESVPWVVGLLESRDRTVSDAAARALGRIRGAASAGALVTAIQRRGLNRRLVAELARSAPDLFIESALGEPQRPSVRPALAMAAGLRRRRAALGPLLALVERGTRRERVIGCRALGWIGSGTAVPALTACLVDPDWKTRMSAAKALGALRARESRNELRFVAVDRNPRVRMAARQALYRIDGAARYGA